MTKTFIGYNGKSYNTEKEKLKADLQFLADLEKSGTRPFIGMDGAVYYNETEYLKANRKYLGDAQGIHFRK